MEYRDYQAAADYIKERLKEDYEIGLVLGTALGQVAESMEDVVRIDYKDIPYFPTSTVDSHRGQLVAGRMGKARVLCMSGRFHYYEGYDFSRLATAVRVLRLVGIKTLIMTNAAGGINEAYNVGDVMLIRDHINFLQASPLRGANIKELGDRFFDMSNAYDKELRRLAKELAADSALCVREGVYAYTAGPQFETPAEIRFFRAVGCDAVGMSTVPEVITAVHCGIRVLGLSVITNMAAGVGGAAVDGSEVDGAVHRIIGELTAYIRSIAEALNK